MTTIPRDPALDNTLNLWLEGYEFVWNRCRRFGSDVFLTRLAGQKAVCIHGAEAAALFYDESKLKRHGALPRRVVNSLFGKNAVHTLDDAQHKRRKEAFLGLMTPNNLARLMDGTADAWRRAVRRWESKGSVVIFDEAQRVLAEAICSWAGVPLSRTELPKRAAQLAEMVDAFGGVGPRLWKGKLARARTERWIEKLIHDVRKGRLQLDDPQSALSVMAQHRELDGSLLDARTAAVEVLNVLRPTVAIAWYVTFAALALHRYPEARKQLAREPLGENAGEYTDLFMQEVRRFYPFTPFLGALVREPFEWRGVKFKPGMMVVLDVYGTDHDPKLWSDPDQFRPERFRNWDGGYYDFIPQGGGRHTTGHRCPGEWITMHNLALALHFLTRGVNYDVVPGQDLKIDLTRMPTRPASGVIIHHVRATAALDAAAPRWPSRTAARDVSGGDAGTAQVHP